MRSRKKFEICWRGCADQFTYRAEVQANLSLAPRLFSLKENIDCVVEHDAMHVRV